MLVFSISFSLNSILCAVCSMRSSASSDLVRQFLAGLGIELFAEGLRVGLGLLGQRSLAFEELLLSGKRRFAVFQRLLELRFVGVEMLDLAQLPLLQLGAVRLGGCYKGLVLVGQQLGQLRVAAQFFISFLKHPLRVRFGELGLVLGFLLRGIANGIEMRIQPLEEGRFFFLRVHPRQTWRLA